MTDNPQALESHRFALTGDHLKHARLMIAPALRYAPRNPLLLAVGLILGVAGVLAWRNRERIAETASPILEDAKAKGEALVGEALIKAHTLMDDAKASSRALGARAARLRRGDAGRRTVSNVF